MANWNVEELKDMRMSAMLARARTGKPYPREANKLIATIEDEIYYQEQRDKLRNKGKNDQPENANSNGETPDNVDVDGLHLLKIGCRTTTFCIDGRAVTFGEFRRAARKKGVDMEKRIKLDDKPERFISRSEVRVEQ